MIDIWLKVNEDSTNRLGIIRDFDNQPNAQKQHEKYNKYENVYVTTTKQYTLEPEIVSTGDNYEKLKTYFEKFHGWTNIDTPESLSEKWQGAKAETMLKFCKDIGIEELSDIELPQHISRVLHFLQSGEKQCK